MQTTWPELLEAPTHRLPLLARDENLPEDLRTYADVLSSFLQGDLEKLKAVAEGLAAGPLRRLACLRLSIRQRRLDDLDDREPLSGVLEGERQFCLGMAWEQKGDDRRSLEHFRRSAAIFAQEKCPRKSLRALYNSIAAETRIEPHKNYLADFQAVIEASRAIGDASFEGMALIAIAREYQIAESYTAALSMIDQALSALASERGTFHYFHALLYRAHILMDLRRPDEARETLKETELASFPQVTATRELLLCGLDATRIWDRGREKDLLPTWRNRIPQMTRTAEPAGASELEIRLLKLAYNGPIEKWDLIMRLYPGESSSLVLENRFKNLIARVRKKFPAAIHCQDGRYSVDRMPVV